MDGNNFGIDAYWKSTKFHVSIKILLTVAYAFLYISSIRFYYIL